MGDGVGKLETGVVWGQVETGVGWGKVEDRQVMWEGKWVRTGVWWERMRGSTTCPHHTHLC